MRTDKQFNAADWDWIPGPSGPYQLWPFIVVGLMFVWFFLYGIRSLV